MDNSQVTSGFDYRIKAPEQTLQPSINGAPPANMPKPRLLDQVRQAIRTDLAQKSGREFVDAGMNRLLEGFLKLSPRRDVDSVTGQPIMRPNLPLPVFTAADTGIVVAFSATALAVTVLLRVHEATGSTTLASDAAAPKPDAGPGAG